MYADQAARPEPSAAGGARPASGAESAGDARLLHGAEGQHGGGRRDGQGRARHADADEREREQVQELARVRPTHARVRPVSGDATTTLRL